jgi:hypothetical protein
MNSVLPLRAHIPPFSSLVHFQTRILLTMSVLQVATALAANLAAKAHSSILYPTSSTSQESECFSDASSLTEGT